MEKHLSEKLMNEVLNRSDLLVYVTDPATDEIIYISDKTKKLLDIDEPKPGLMCWEIMDPQGLGACVDCARARLAADPSAQFASEGYNSANGHYYKRIDSRIEWPDGRTVDLHTLVDFTDAMRSENLTERFEQDIEKAQEEAEKERTSKHNFMSLVSHEIRTELNSMLGMLSVARDSDDSVRKDYALERIELIAGNLIDLADEIAALSDDESWEDFANREKTAPTVFADETKQSMEEARRASIDLLKSLDGCTVMLVEDVDVNREIILMYLEDTGLRVDVATTGLEAFNKFKDNPDKYGMILMDIQMPEMDGYEATQRIRALGTEHAKSVPIVAMTANAFSEDIDKSFLAGMDDHITKPVDWTDLLTLLVYYLGPKRQ